MPRVFAFSVLVLGIALGGCARDQTQPTEKKGVHVTAPGVNVQVEKGSVGVKAPGVEVNVPK